MLQLSTLLILINCNFNVHEYTVILKEFKLFVVEIVFGNSVGEFSKKSGIFIDKSTIFQYKISGILRVSFVTKLVAILKV